jgi:hypothetical protein
VQLQGELREPAAQLSREPLSVVLVLEPDDEVIREPRDNNIPARLRLPPVIDPEVQDIMQIYIRKQRGQHAPNANGNFCFDVTLGYRRLERGR